MNQTYDYIIAGISLRSYVDLVGVGLRGFKPFEHEVSGEPNCTFELKADLEAKNLGTTTRISTCYLAEADCNSELHKCDDGYLYIVEGRAEDEKQIIFYINISTNHIESNIGYSSSYETASSLAVLDARTISLAPRALETASEVFDVPPVPRITTFLPFISTPA